MYIALGIMLAGIVAGRLLSGFLNPRFLRRLIMLAIFSLLFLLGVSIGSNKELLARLPELGWRAFVLMLFAVGGSIAAVMVIKPFLRVEADSSKHDKKRG